MYLVIYSTGKNPITMDKSELKTARGVWKDETGLRKSGKFTILKKINYFVSSVR